MKMHPHHENQDNARLMVAIVVSLAILFGFHHFYDKPRQEQAIAAQEAALAAPRLQAAAPAAHVDTVRPREAVLAEGARIKIDGEKVKGSLPLKGARIDDITLNDYLAEIDRDAPVALLTPSGAEGSYYVESGWVSADNSVRLPDAQTVWSLAAGSDTVLKSGGSITLEWNNGQGLQFKRRIALDDDYLFTITQTVTNKGASTAILNAWHLISRRGVPEDFKGFFILHEGPLTYLNGKLNEIDYDDLRDGERVTHDGVDGWLGISDKYWFVGIMPPAGEKFDARVLAAGNNRETYQADVMTGAYTLAPGDTIEDQKMVFTGVKRLPVLQGYEDLYGIRKFDLVLDFGMLYFITKPLFFLLHILMDTIGNVGLAILAMTVVVRIAVFPLASKAFRSMAGMKKVAPQLKELQEKYGKDREKLQVEIFDLYKREKVNPFSGCWPLLIQIPIFFALYKVILISVELRHAPFWGWINDLSAPDPTNLFTLFGLLPWNPPSFLHIGLWPVLFCLTMIVQKRLSPPMPDKTQEQVQAIFPYIITFMLANFAAGLVIYWTWSNVLGVLQQYYIMRSVGDQDVSLLGHKQRRKKKAKHSG